MWLQSNTTYYQISHSTPCVTETYTKHPVLYPRIITQSYITLSPSVQLPQARHYTKHKFHRLLSNNKYHPEIPSISLYTIFHCITKLHITQGDFTLHKAVPGITMCYPEVHTLTQLRVTTIRTIRCRVKDLSGLSDICHHRKQNLAHSLTHRAV